MESDQFKPTLLSGTEMSQMYDDLLKQCEVAELNAWVNWQRAKAARAAVEAAAGRSSEPPMTLREAHDIERMNRRRGDK